MKKALRVTTEGDITEIDLSRDSLTALQEGVGGWVQAIDLTTTMSMWCNEEGKLQGLPHNPFAQAMWDKAFGAGTDYIVGDVVFTSTPDDEGYTQSVTAEDERVIRAMVAKTHTVVGPAFAVLDWN